MNIRAQLEMTPYERRLWWVMLAGCATRFTAERSVAEALPGFAFWTLVFTACWVLRRVLWQGPDGASRAEKAANVLAIAGMALFAIQLTGSGIVPALLTFLFAIQAAVFVSARVRLHVWLVIAAALAGVMFAAAASRSMLFVLGAGWFTFAALSLLAFDQHALRAALASASPVGSSRTSAGGAQFAVVVLLAALPAYLFLPKPPGIELGGMQAATAHDYRDDYRSDESFDTTTEPLEVPRDATPSAEGAAGEAASSQAASSTAAPATAPAQPQSGSYGDEWSIADVDRSGGAGDGGAGQGNRIVLYVKSSQPLYLRGKLFDRFERDRWHRTSRSTDRRLLTRGRYTTDGAAALAEVEQTIEVVANLDSTLVHTPALKSLRFPGPAVHEYDDGVFAAPRPLRADTTYSVLATLDLMNGRYVLPEPIPDADRYLEVPDEITPRVRSLAWEVVQGIDSAESRALKLEAWLRENYQYSFATIQWQGYTPLDWFLFESRRGHCEYFASALAMMLRVVGIPARVATGFSLGERNPMTGYYEVRQLDGHAWVEAYIPDRGWLMLEPTPFYPLPPDEPEAGSDVAEQLERYLERMAQTSQTLDPDSVRTSLIELARQIWMAMRAALRQLSELPAALGWYLPALVVAAFLLGLGGKLALLAHQDAIEMRRVQAMLSQIDDADVRQSLLVLSDALHIVAESRGVGRHLHETLREYAARGRPGGRALPAEFAEIFEQSRYGSDAVNAPAQVIAQVRAIVVDLLRQVRWPRTRAQVQAWRACLQSLLPLAAAEKQYRV